MERVFVKLLLGSRTDKQKSLEIKTFPVVLDAPYRDRTCDPRIKSPLLCQLS